MNKQEWLKQEVEKLGFEVYYRVFGSDFEIINNKLPILQYFHEQNVFRVNFFDNHTKLKDAKKLIEIAEQYKDME